MIKLTEEDKLKLIPDEWERTIKIDLSSGPCYAKFTGNTGAFRELFGKKIFDIVGIQSADYTFYKEKNCIVSTDLSKKYENFKQASHYGDIYNLGELHKIAKQFNNYDELCLNGILNAIIECFAEDAQECSRILNLMMDDYMQENSMEFIVGKFLNNLWDVVSGLADNLNKQVENFDLASIMPEDMDADKLVKFLNTYVK
jgi:hypothetical protein